MKALLRPRKKSHSKDEPVPSPAPAKPPPPPPASSNNPPPLYARFATTATFNTTDTKGPALGSGRFGADENRSAINGNGFGNGVHVNGNEKPYSYRGASASTDRFGSERLEMPRRRASEDVVAKSTPPSSMRLTQSPTADPSASSTSLTQKSSTGALTRSRSPEPGPILPLKGTRGAEYSTPATTNGRLPDISNQDFASNQARQVSRGNEYGTPTPRSSTLPAGLAGGESAHHPRRPETEWGTPLTESAPLPDVAPQPSVRPPVRKASLLATGGSTTTQFSYDTARVSRGPAHPALARQELVSSLDTPRASVSSRLPGNDLSGPAIPRKASGTARMVSSSSEPPSDVEQPLSRGPRSGPEPSREPAKPLPPLDTSFNRVPVRSPSNGDISLYPNSVRSAQNGSAVPSPRPFTTSPVDGSISPYTDSSAPRAPFSRFGPLSPPESPPRTRTSPAANTIWGTAPPVVRKTSSSLAATAQAAPKPAPSPVSAPITPAPSTDKVSSSSTTSSDKPSIPSRDTSTTPPLPAPKVPSPESSSSLKTPTRPRSPNPTTTPPSPPKVASRRHVTDPARPPFEDEKPTQYPSPPFAPTDSPKPHSRRHVTDPVRPPIAEPPTQPSLEAKLAREDSATSTQSSTQSQGPASSDTRYTFVEGIAAPSPIKAKSAAIRPLPVSPAAASPPPQSSRASVDTIGPVAAEELVAPSPVQARPVSIRPLPVTPAAASPPPQEQERPREEKRERDRRAEEKQERRERRAEEKRVKEREKTHASKPSLLDTYDDPFAKLPMAPAVGPATPHMRQKAVSTPAPVDPRMLAMQRSPLSALDDPRPNSSASQRHNVPFPQDNTTTPPGTPPPEEPTFYPLHEHLKNQDLLALLLVHLSFQDWCALSSINRTIRRDLEDNPSLREEVMERYLHTVGYERWEFDIKEPIVLSFKDLNAYMRGVSMPMYQFTHVAENYIASQEKTKTNMVRNLASSCRAYTKLVLRLRAQAEADHAARGGGPLPGSRPPSTTPRRTPSTRSKQASSPNPSGRFRSPLFRIGHAPLLRVFVPSPEGVWLSDESVLDCEKELKRAGVIQMLRVGDVVWDAALADDGNVGRMIWDGNYLIDLDYTYSQGGEIPRYLHSLQFPPSYFHKVIWSIGNPIIQIDISTWGREIASNLQLVQDRTTLETPNGGRHNVIRWVHRSRFRIRTGTIVAGTEGFLIDPGWAGLIILEAEGTNEGLADLQARCGPGSFPNRPGIRPKPEDGGRVFRLLRDRSRPGEIWIRMVREKDRI